MRADHERGRYFWRFAVLHRYEAGPVERDPALPTLTFDRRLRAIELAITARQEARERGPITSAAQAWEILTPLLGDLAAFDAMFLRLRDRMTPEAMAEMREVFAEALRLRGEPLGHLDLALRCMFSADFEPSYTALQLAR